MAGVDAADDRRRALLLRVGEGKSKRPLRARARRVKQILSRPYLCKWCTSSSGPGRGGLDSVLPRKPLAWGNGSLAELRHHVVAQWALGGVSTCCNLHLAVRGARHTRGNAAGGAWPAAAGHQALQLRRHNSKSPTQRRRLALQISTCLGRGAGCRPPAGLCAHKPRANRAAPGKQRAWFGLSFAKGLLSGGLSSSSAGEPPHRALRRLWTSPRGRRLFLRDRRAFGAASAPQGLANLNLPGLPWTARAVPLPGAQTW